MTLRRALTVALTTGAFLLATGCADEEENDPVEDGQAQTEEQETSDEDSGTTEGSGDEISMSEVEANDSTESCWTVVEGTVYDVTDWIDQHPGGPDRIEQLCGTDGTDMFTGQHSGQSQPEGQLTEFEIGELTD